MENSIEETKTKIRRKYIGSHSIHGVGYSSKNGPIIIHSERELTERVRKSIEELAKPYAVRYYREVIPLAAQTP